MRPHPLLTAVLLTAALLAAATTAQDPAAIAAAAQQLTAQPALRGARIGLVVADAGTGAVLHAQDADKGFMTASNMKLISAAVALRTLGADFRYATTLATAAPVMDGTLQGDLLLVGGGDPALGGRPLKEPMAALAPFVAALQAQGIRRIDGRIVGVDDCQADEAYGTGWQWDYLDDDYAAPFGGLNFAENVVRVHVAGTAPGEPPRIRLEPDADHVRVQTALRCGEPGSATALRARRRAGSSTIELGGRIAAGAPEQTLRVAIENPTLQAAAALRAALLQAGIEVTGPAADLDDLPGPHPEALRALHVERSAELAAILVPLLKDSVNLYAEQLLRSSAQLALGRSDSDSAAEHGRKILQALGVDPAGMVLADGSGLSRRILVQPRQLAQLLLGVWNAPERDAFVACLPVAGVDGTLRARFRDNPARGHARAKTGFIGGVVALSGYLERPEDRAPLVFVTLLNNFTCSSDDAKAAVDAWLGALAAAAGWPAR